MKKKMGALGGLLMAVVVTGYSVAGTYAKYTSSLDFADEARVAKWNFTLNGQTTTKNLDIDLFAKSYEVSTNESTNKLAEGETSVTDVVSDREGVKVVAPGTRGTYTFELEGTAETNYTVEFAAELTNEIKKDSYDPLYFRLNTKDTAGTWMTSEDFEAYLNKTVQDANNTVYAANSTLGQEYTIEWMWAFDGKDTTTLPGFVSNNVLDTELAQLVGADNNGALVRLDVQLTINQSDKAAGTDVTVERLNEVEATSAEDFIAAINNADAEEIKLTSDLTSATAIDVERSVNINLNGHTLNARINAKKGNVNIENGKINTTGRSIDASGVGTIVTLNNVEVTSGNQAINATYNARVVFNSGKVNSHESALVAYNAGTLEVNGGTFTTVDNSVISTNGSNGRGGNTIVVNGGTFNGNITSPGYIANGIYVANSDKVVVNGGTFNITDGTGILARSGNVTVSDDVVFNCTGTSSGWIGDKKFNIPSGKDIVINTGSGYPGGEPTVTVSAKYNVVTVNG